MASARQASPRPAAAAAAAAAAPHLQLQACSWLWKQLHSFLQVQHNVHSLLPSRLCHCKAAGKTGVGADGGGAAGRPGMRRHTCGGAAANKLNIQVVAHSMLTLLHLHLCACGPSRGRKAGGDCSGGGAVAAAPTAGGLKRAAKILFVDWTRAGRRKARAFSRLHARSRTSCKLPPVGPLSVTTELSETSKRQRPSLPPPPCRRHISAAAAAAARSRARPRLSMPPDEIRLAAEASVPEGSARVRCVCWPKGRSLHPLI